MVIYNNNNKKMNKHKILMLQKKNRIKNKH